MINTYVERKNRVFNQAATDLFIVLLILVMDGSLCRTNCDFETPIPQNIGGTGIEYILVLGFFAARLRPKRTCNLSQPAADILVVMASKSRK